MASGEAVTQTEVVEVNVLAEKRQTFTEAGKLYKGILGTYLQSGDLQAKEQAITNLVNGASEAVQGFFREVPVRLSTALAKNHSLVVAHPGTEVEYLYNEVMDGADTPVNSRQRVLEAIPGKTHFIEPTPGVAIVETEKDFFYLVQAEGVGHPESSAIAYLSDNPEQPTFAVVRRLALQQSLLGEGVSAFERSTARHEFHHLLWHFLQMGKAVPEVEETTPELTQAFRHFRDEIGAYILEERPFGEIDSEALVYTQDRTILQRAGQTNRLAWVAFDIGRRLGVEPDGFAFGALSARNFDEFTQNFLDLVPTEGVKPGKLIDDLYSIWSSRRAYEQPVVDFIHRDRINITPESVISFSNARIQNYQPEYGGTATLAGLIDASEHLRNFAGHLGVDLPDISNAVFATAQSRMSLPAETITVLLSWPDPELMWTSLDRTPEEFIRSHVNIFAVRDEESVNLIRQLISSSPQMRQLFDSLRENLIEEGTKNYIQEMGGPGRAERVKVELEKRVAILRTL